MMRCIQLAKNGLGTTYPNPLVGSVIVHNTTIIGEGWHYQAGQPHAEVHAVKSCKDTLLLSEATIYVSLEPCSHFGKTPPCVNLIISEGIKKVVIGTTDPNPKVAGQGIKRLMEAGCDVVVGVLEDDCNQLNKRFFTFQQKKRPYIILKWAQTADGFVAPQTKKEQKPVWITNEFSRQLAHKLRAQEQAILIGTNTAKEDNPSLTTRDWFGNNPLRVVLDRKNSLDKKLAFYTDDLPTLMLTEQPTESAGNTSFEVLDFKKEIALHSCNLLYKKGIQSVLVEGGSKTLQTFIDANLWDEALVFVGKATYTKGIKAPVFDGALVKQNELAEDVLFYYKNSTL